MKINPDDPWYPIVTANDPCLSVIKRGVTIRLKLAAEMMKSPDWFAVWFGDVSPENVGIDEFINGALGATDAMIERVNREEGKPNG